MMAIVPFLLGGEGTVSPHRQPQSRPAPRAPAFLLRGNTGAAPCVALVAMEVGSTNCPCAEPPVASRTARKKLAPAPWYSYRAGAFLDIPAHSHQGQKTPGIPGG